ncbi:MAG TPA: CPBP family intramembrane glutamic endopeptidase [Terriglobales bacterium]|jgi:membrane protease YdiL (CAAX protease family)|nr:CPBP family intramembrane glutamic endopeptidase [Terriglobales bacterium]
MVKRSHVVMYVALVALLSLPWYLLVIHTKELGMGQGRVVHTLMWCPTLAALLTCYLGGISISSLGFTWPKLRYIGLGYGLPILYALLAYIPYWIAVRGSFNLAGFSYASATSLQLQTTGPALLLNLFLLLGYGVISGTTSGLGEEIGWRGFLFPALLKLGGPVSAILISGLIWALWHYPGILGSNYNSGGPAWVALVCFTWMVISGAAIFGWLRVKSGSVWPAAIAHGSHNLFIQAICDPLTRSSRSEAIWTTEFGILLALTTTIVALVCWLRYPPEPTSLVAVTTQSKLVIENAVR